jgi:hypothetical protein
MHVMTPTPITADDMIAFLKYMQSKTEAHKASNVTPAIDAMVNALHEANAYLAQIAEPEAPEPPEDPPIDYRPAIGAVESALRSLSITAPAIDLKPVFQVPTKPSDHTLLIAAIDRLAKAQSWTTLTVEVAGQFGGQSKTYKFTKGN